jgi:hypothetical protein
LLACGIYVICEDQREYMAAVARELIVLRAHQITGPALRWLLGLPSQEGLRVWLVSPRPLPAVADVDGVPVIRTSPTGAWPDRNVSAHDPRWLRMRRPQPARAS